MMTSCAATRMAVPTPATLPSGRRYSAPKTPRATRSRSSMRPAPGTTSNLGASSPGGVSYARHISLRERSMRFPSSRAPSRTRGAFSFAFSFGAASASAASRDAMSLAKRVSQRGSKRLRRTFEPGRHTKGYGTTGMENSPGSFSPSYATYSGVRSSPKTSSVRDAAGDESSGGRVPDAAAPARTRFGASEGSSTSNHSHSGRSASATSSAGPAASLARNAARANLGRTGMSRNTIWICCRRRVEVLMARNAASLASFFALAAATRSRISARALSASSSRRRSSSSAASVPRSALRASIVRLEDDSETGSADAPAAASEGGRHRASATFEEGPRDILRIYVAEARPPRRLRGRYAARGTAPSRRDAAAGRAAARPDAQVSDAMTNAGKRVEARWQSEESTWPPLLPKWP